MCYTLFACVAFMTAQVPSAGQANGYIALEYCYLPVDFHNPFISVADQFGKLVDSLNKLGMKGWEIVSLKKTLEGPLAGEGAPKNFFRRPLAENQRRKWEYRVLDLGEYGMNRTMPKEPANAQGKVLERLEKESLQGWKLVESFSGPQGQTERYFLLKRAK
jgi:hypothetical protein